jgi:regulator of sirC expression with transglutaminase-like and TPR domain
LDTQPGKELSALINLLDEPDENAFVRIREKIFSFGQEAIPVLENAWENSFEGIVQERIEGIVKKIQQDVLLFEFSDWIKLGSTDLLKGFLLVSRSQYPDLDQENITIRIEQMKMDAWLELNDNLTALENIKVLNHIIFDLHNFDGNKINIHAPQNSYINTLLETRKGSPLTLGMLYLIIAQKLNVPVYGVNLPQHFILAYTTEIVKPIPDENDVLFYINPFNKGAIFTRREIELFIRQLKVKPVESFFAPCTNIEIIKRLINNLKFSYERSGQQDKIDDLETLLNLME